MHSWTKKSFVAPLILVGTLLSGCDGEPPASGPVSGVTSGSSTSLIGQTAPELETTTLDGQPFKLGEFREGQIVMLDFWASWCGPCVVELPILMKLAEEFGTQGVRLCAVNCGEDEQTIRDFLAEQKWKLNPVLDPAGDAAQRYGVDGIPQLFLIDRQGLIQNALIGYSPDVEIELRKQLRAMIDSQPPTPETPERA